MKKWKILGFPYEEGTYWRKGTKWGPSKIREQLSKMREYSVNSDKYMPFDLNSIDEGDILLDPYSKKTSLKKIEDEVDIVLSKGVQLVSLGGDHSITLPILRSYHKKHRDFGIIHLDAHSDTFEPVNGYKYHHGAFIKNAVEEGLVNPQNIYQLGLRGQLRKPGFEFAEKQMINLIKMAEFRKLDFSIVKRLRNKSIPYYLSIDIDVVDPAFAPGTGTPVPGGMTSFEILELMKEVSNFNIIGADIVEVAPVYDTSEITSLLAANILFELLCNL
ncbi:MAG: agmatinase [Chitinophagaceae bacterium]|nr:agmatinase [Chitinophagaceae bacterium]